MVNRLRLILGDQLNEAHSWFSEKDDQTLYVIAELHEEATYVGIMFRKSVPFSWPCRPLLNHLKPMVTKYFI